MKKPEARLQGAPKSDSDWLREALEEAKLAAAEDEVPVGAVVVHDGIAVATGRNAREKLQSPLSHAELHAILAASKHFGSWRLVDCDLYVTLEPCPMCLAACQQARVRRVVYGAKDPKGGAISLGYRIHEDARTHHRFAVEFVEDERCGGILTEFFRAKRGAGSPSGV
jgi:tRNA(adenine34) deaminase